METIKRGAPLLFLCGGREGGGYMETEWVSWLLREEGPP